MHFPAHAIDKIGILYVDDEEKALKYFTESFEDIAPIFTAKSAAEGLEMFRRHQREIGIVLSDQKMPGLSGIEFLEKIRTIDEQPLRILVTAYSDLDLAVEYLNDGLLYSYLTKPWDPADLQTRLKKSLDRFWISRERDKLLRERAVAFQEMLRAEKAASIGILSSGLNHHIRNALTVVQAFFDMIPMQLQEEANGKARDDFFWNEYYEKVEEQIGRMISILSNLDEGAGSGSFQNPVLHIKEGIDLIRIIESADEEALIASPGIEFTLAEAPDLHTITADIEKVSRMVRSIINEAAANADSSGQVEIRVSNATLESSGAQAVRIQCIDDGEPVPEKERCRLFDPFLVRADRPGELGTDLVACYLAAFQHGGTVQATTSEDGRNMIELLLPVIPTAPAGGEIFTRLIEDTIKKSKTPPEL
ncbi:hybrid sensor histidine kinase/response regulator [Verrucomicrobiales bacterium BCK34]|nr:hybrid sensor histidine kinase/response regulator [Verrucomicrobiales bacterium BCK34]